MGYLPLFLTQNVIHTLASCKPSDSNETATPELFYMKRRKNLTLKSKCSEFNECAKKVFYSVE
jgi:hypothetical protein